MRKLKGVGIKFIKGSSDFTTHSMPKPASNNVVNVFVIDPISKTDFW